MHLKSTFRRACAALSAFAVLVNLAPALFQVPMAHASVNVWTESYWNVAADGPFVFPETEPDFQDVIPDGAAPNFYLGDASPVPGTINADNFVARYDAVLSVTAGTYGFRTYTDDGVRLYVDDVLIIDQWVDQGEALYTATATLSAGEHDVVMEYYEHAGGATIHLDYNLMAAFGQGTSAHPYLIHDCGTLQTIQGDLTSHYQLAHDIDCADTSNWNYNAGLESNVGFIPLGDTSYRFSGELNGNGYAISNLIIDNIFYNYAGLFSVIDEGGSVHDLNLEDVDITGQDYVGALAGGLSGTATNIIASGVVNGQNVVGGLVGTHVEPGGIGSSSPLVFTWNGAEYKYIADVGRGIPRNVVGNDETPVSNGDLIPKDGKYSVKISEEYNEIVYYDELSLTTVDHAPGYEIATSFARNAREGFTTIAETPSHPLQSCTDQYGNDCLEDLQNNDDKWSYQDDSNVNYWTMNFGDLSEASRIQLVVRGARNFSIKKGTTVKYIQVKNAEGAWVNAYTSAQLSTLGGTPLNRVIDMTGKFLTSDYSVRVAFDRTRINSFSVDTSAPVEYTVNTVHPSTADLGFHGYTAIDKTYYWNHDYETVSSTPSEIFATQNGNFTKYGDVAPLLDATDDQFVVIHHGDQMDIQFDYTAPAEGMERSFLLYNWATFKHADMGEAGRTVDPLPFNGMTKYPYESPEAYPMTSENIDYLNTWNTRVVNDPAVDHGSTIIDSYSTANVYGANDVGGLVGYNAKLITGSYSTGDVVASNNFVGGLVGEGDSAGEIVHSYATGGVYGDSGASYYVGGLVGLNYGTIETSFASGDVNGYEYVGGLTGLDYGLTTNAYARGNVNGSFSVGGLVGQLDGGTLTNAYSTGIPTAEGAGGLAGAGTGATVNASFWDRETSLTEASAYGSSYTTMEMLQDVTYTDAGWNFDTIWQRSDEVNNGYPTFQAVVVDSESHSRAERLQQVNGDGWDDPEDGTQSTDTSSNNGSDNGNSGNNSEDTNTPQDPGPIGEDHGPIPTYNDYTGHNEAPEAGHTGISPWDATVEPVSDIAKGWYIRGENFDTVYFIAEDGTRRPFWDAKTFRTWANWSDVIWVTDATLATTKVGKPMTPKPGVVLVKVQGEPETYAIGEDVDHNPLLREIPSEAVAIAVYGRDWADYVIDIPPTMLTLLGKGEAVSSNDHPDMGLMMTRDQLGK